MTYTEQHIVELKKCLASPSYFIENHVHLETPHGQKLMKLTDKQARFTYLAEEEQIVVGEFDRCEGKTTVAAANVLHHTIFKQNQMIVAIGHTHAAAMSMKKLVETMFWSVPKYMRPNVTFKNATSLQFDNGNRMVFCAPTPQALRGMTLNMVWVDEPTCMKPDYFNHLLVSMMPCIHVANAKLLFTGTDIGDKLSHIPNAALMSARWDKIRTNLWTYNG